MDAFATITPIPSVPSVDSLTYRVPGAFGPSLAPGMRVLVPLGRRRVTGIVTELVDTAPVGDFDYKDVEAVLDEQPIVDAGLLRLAAWMAEYYGTGLADVLSLAVGRGLTAASKRIARLVDAAAATGSTEKAVIEILEEAGGSLDTSRIRKRLEGRSIDSALASLAKRGAIEIDETLDDPAVKERRETVVRLSGRADDGIAGSLFKRAPKRQQIYEYLLGHPDREATSKEISEVFGSVTQQIVDLEAAGLVKRDSREVYRGFSFGGEQAEPHQLSDAQQTAFDAIVKRLGSFSPILLQGVTSSGKTEVYLHAVREALARGGSALVLVPEISLTHQLVARLVGRFGPTVAVLHSELSAGERWDQWRRIVRGEARIAVGARSAVLAPLPDLALIVVDEEHDGAFKQADGVRYHGRDVAVVRAQQVGCPVVLGSATPSIETWSNARSGKYTHLVLRERVTPNPLPGVEVVDLRGRDIVATGGLSQSLTKILEGNYRDGGQTLLFLNRRGFASNMQCYECGELVECDHCSVGLVFHNEDSTLRCHHCDAKRKVPERCPSCSADSLIGQGLGTQRLEETIKRLLPDARVERLDRDTSARKGSAEKLLSEWRAGRIDVLIGTQMIAKGHDAAGVTLVGVVQADLALGVPDFRSAERTFQILSQVAGRAGRGDRRGRVIFQTYQPDHFAIAAAVRHDYEAFAEIELAEREDLGYPPFSRMALLRFEGKYADAVRDVAQVAAGSLMELARKSEGLVVRGPAPAPIERVKSRYRYQVQLRAPDAGRVRHAAFAARDALVQKAKKRGVRVLVDIDPVDML
jgi:primosomal protein N' (replication factor Y)